MDVVVVDLHLGSGPDGAALIQDLRGLGVAIPMLVLTAHVAHGTWTAANDLGATAFLVTLDHAECVTLLSVEPRAGATVAQRPGTRHPLSVGAPGIAIQSLLADAQLAGIARRPLDARGWASSHDEVIAGLSSVAVPLALPGSAPSAIAAVFVAGSADADAVGVRLLAARDAILL